MKTLCIVPCGKQKVWDKRPEAGPTPARDVYTGNFTTQHRKYAEQFYPHSWCILSAKHGFLLPDDVLEEGYDVKFGDGSPEEINDQALADQVKRKHLDEYETIVALCSCAYRRHIEKAFPGKALKAPLAGCRDQEEMMQRLRRAMDRGHPL